MNRWKIPNFGSEKILASLRAKLPFSRILDILFIAMLLFFIVQRVPMWREQWALEGTHPKKMNFELQGTLGNSKSVNLSTNKTMAIVFWATWCGPCKVALDRLNEHYSGLDPVQQSELASKLFVVSSGEESSLVQAAAQQRQYKFPVFSEAGGELAAQYHISGTPAVVLLNSGGAINDISMGLVPFYTNSIWRHLAK